jgi:hypothetical protein
MVGVCVCVIAVWLTVNLICLLVALYCGWRDRPQKKPTRIGSEPAPGSAQVAVTQNASIGSRSMDCGLGHHYIGNNPSTKQPSAPRCFGCARPMQLIRRTPRFGGLADLYVFHCSACDEWHVEEGDELASVPVSLGGSSAASGSLARAL